MAGLAAAVAASGRGLHVHLYEASGHAGGRCRSFFDTRLDRVIDNGNHLLLSGNRAVMRYLEVVGASGSLVGPARATFPFVDVRTGERWCVRPSQGAVPWWMFRADHRIPGTSLRDYASVLRIARARATETVHDCVGSAGVLYERFWKPFAVGVLNTPATAGAASLLWPVLRETFVKGERHCRPRIARLGLSEALVKPALTWLRGRHASIRFSHALRTIQIDDRHATVLDFGHRRVCVTARDRVILAVPPWAAAQLLSGLVVPDGYCAIVNAHFVLPEPVQPHVVPLVGVIGGAAQWIFLRGDVASVTVSAANALTQRRSEDLAIEIWQDVAKALGLAAGIPPPYRIIKEKRATFRQSPDNLRCRPKTATAVANLLLAGAWTDTGLPDTIEGAVRSGFAAATH